MRNIALNIIEAIEKERPSRYSKMPDGDELQEEEIIEEIIKLIEGKYHVKRKEE